MHYDPGRRDASTGRVLHRAPQRAARVLRVQRKQHREKEENGETQ